MKNTNSKMQIKVEKTNPELISNNIFKPVSKRRSISILDNESFVNNKMSIDTKDTTLLMSSQKFSTIGARRTL